MIDLQNSPLVYVTRDIERALGLLGTPGYFIISNNTPFGQEVQAQYPENILLIESEELLDTSELLKHEETKKFIAKSQPSARAQVEGEPIVLVFKNTSQIEKICSANNWTVLNPPASLANKVEEKISQVEWLGDLATCLPPHGIILCKDIVWKDTPFILQFNRAHTGTGTMFVENEKQLKDIQTKFPDRPARVTKYIDGPVFTCNIVVGNDAILAGNISYQITGLSPFTDNRFATIGNDWKLPHTLLNETQKQQINDIAQGIGEKMRADGWKGLFGIDVILEESTGELFLIEINARQPASTTYESVLQERIKNQELRIGDVTTFEAHILALLNQPLADKKLITIEEGAQVIVRNLESRIWNLESITNISSVLKKNGFRTIEYTNTKPGTDRLRIQSEKSCMKTHNAMNELGENIRSTINSKF